MKQLLLFPTEDKLLDLVRAYNPISDGDLVEALQKEGIVFLGKNGSYATSLYDKIWEDPEVTEYNNQRSLYSDVRWFTLFRLKPSTQKLMTAFRKAGLRYSLLDTKYKLMIGRSGKSNVYDTEGVFTHE